ncbi:MAG: hypothetical protein PVH79_03600 [Candidatus Bathyarchaeota archaeon]
MSAPRGLGFGGFLIGIGAGWLIFSTYDVSRDLIAWLLIIIGGAIILTSMISYLRPRVSFSGGISSFAVGLVIAMVITSGIGMLFPWNWDWDSGPAAFTEEGTEAFSGTVQTQGLLFRTDIVNGQVNVTSWDRDDYSVDLLIKAKGNSQNEAQSNLEKVNISLDERLDSERTDLVLIVDVPTLTWTRVSVLIDVIVPSDTLVDLDVETTNGAVYVTGISGNDIDIATTNGKVDFESVKADNIGASTTNGNIEGIVEASVFSGETTNGKVMLEISSRMSGYYDLSTTNGAVEVTVNPGTEVGYVFDLRTTIGGVTVDLANVDYTTNENRQKVGETTGYSGKTIKIEIKARATNGSISLED